ncbi:radical SAM protein [Prosthecomicrobium hirschii]|uniref:4Fe-4S single cluster domain-containing protein n=1 Tax=Prosthecodimorpha hirschii TaxID=665126 RepID=UPI00112B8D56|nr:4Fe-4S single cluster domain-containing protein [Prosthecomicrobium hirschii]TPQ52868.1 radical SAM protein [Prosthecomicrobium hirschii]
MTAIFISRMHFPVTTLGPGRRIGIWLQGCSIRCPGCISMDTWATDRGRTSVAQVMEMVRGWLPEAGGITLSGGEPFDQPEALHALLKALRAESRMDVFAYSGHPYERIAGHIAAMDGLIDALMSDPYEQATAQTLALRGSDNQRLHLLTPLGRARFASFDRPVSDAERRFDVMLDEDGAAWLAGVPARDDFRRLRFALAGAGHDAVTSEDRRVVPGKRARVEWK